MHGVYKCDEMLLSRHPFLNIHVQGGLPISSSY